MQARKEREKAENSIKSEEQPEVTEITEELKSKVCSILMLGVSTQRLRGIVNISSETFEEIKRILKKER